MLLAMADRRLGIAKRLARCFPDRRDPLRITHTLADMVRARILAIACGYEDADDLDALRADPAFKLACGRLPDTGANLCSQPTLSRLENAPSLKDAIRLTWALVDQWMASYEREPASVILDIDDTCDVVHGHQQLSLFNAHYDERCFLPMMSTTPSARVPSRSCCASAPCRVSRCAPICAGRAHIRQRWTRSAYLSGRRPAYARSEAMDGARSTTSITSSGCPVEAAGEENRRGGGRGGTERALSNKPVSRGYAETRHKANPWSRERRAVARMNPLRSARHPFRRHQRRKGGGMDYAALYCARGQAENLIKLHKTQLASDRTSCRSAIANQCAASRCTRRVIGLMLTVRDAIPKPRDVANAESRPCDCG